MTDGKIYTDEEMEPSDALKYITDDWVGEAQYCEQTVIDLRDYALSLEARVAELEGRLSMAVTDIDIMLKMDIVYHKMRNWLIGIRRALKEVPWSIGDM